MVTSVTSVTKGPHLLSPQDGAIDHVLLSWGTTDMIIGHAGFLQARPDIQRVTVLLPRFGLWRFQNPAQESMEEAYLKIMRSYGIDTAFDFVQIESNHIPSFTQNDPHVLVESGMTYILHSTGEREVGMGGCGRGTDGGACPIYLSLSDLFDPLCRYLDAACMEIPQTMSGGNLIAGGTALFAGVENDDPHALEALNFFGESGDVIVVGDSIGEQAVYDIDMFITPTEIIDPFSGKPIVFVGDINLARNKLKTVPAETLRNYEWNWEGTAVVWDSFFMSTDIYSYFDQIPHYLDHPEFSGGLVQAITAPSPNQQKMAQVLDENALELKAKGFHVIRIPLLNIPYDGYISYNNALMERGRVTMPVYQIPELDEMATSIYTQAGLEVVPVKGFEMISLKRGGSLRCAVKEMERSPGGLDTPSQKSFEGPISLKRP